MIVKVAPLGEKVTEVNVNEGTSIASILSIAGVELNGRSIRVGGNVMQADEGIDTEGSIITLAMQMKGGK